MSRGRKSKTKQWFAGLAWTALLLAAAGLSASAVAKPGDAKSGKLIYAKRGIPT